MLEVGAEVAVCSSIMPQKKNPAGIEYTKAKASHAVGALMGCISSLKNIPFSNNLDIHEALWLFGEGTGETRKALGMLAESLRYSRVNKEHALAKARTNFSTVTGLADHLVITRGLSFEEAHKVVGNMVRAVLDEGTGMEGMSTSLLRKVSKETLGQEITLPEEELQQALDPAANVEAKMTLGRPGAASVAAMTEKAEAAQQEQRNWLKNAQAHVERACRRLEEEDWKLRAGCSLI